MTEDGYTFTEIKRDYNEAKWKTWTVLGFAVIITAGIILFANPNEGDVPNSQVRAWVIDLYANRNIKPDSFCHAHFTDPVERWHGNTYVPLQEVCRDMVAQDQAFAETFTVDTSTFVNTHLRNGTPQIAFMVDTERRDRATSEITLKRERITMRFRADGRVSYITRSRTHQ